MNKNVEVIFGIPRAGAEKNHKSPAAAADGLTVYIDLRSAHSLNQGFHYWLILSTLKTPGSFSSLAIILLRCSTLSALTERVAMQFPPRACRAFIE